MTIAEELGFLRPDVVIEPLADGFTPAGFADTVRLFREPAPQETGRPDGSAVNLWIPFRHPGLTELALARIRPTSADRLRMALELDDDFRVPLAGLLCEEPSFSPDRHVTRGGRVRYFGNGSVLVQSPKGSVVCDPFVGGGGGDAGGYTVDDLPDYIDVALLTEGRVSRAVTDSLLQLRGRIARVVVPRAARGADEYTSLRPFLSRLGLPMIEVDDFDEVRFPGGTVVAAPAAGPARCTHHVRMAGASVFLGSEAFCPDPAGYRGVRDRLGRIDMAFFAMMRDGRVSLDAVRAAEVVTALGAEEAYLYADDAPADRGEVPRFLSWCSDRGIVAEQLHGKREWVW